MAVIDWDTLKHQWEHEQMSMKQMIGQLLQWGDQTHQASTAQARQLTALERQVTVLTARVTALESQRMHK